MAAMGFQSRASQSTASRLDDLLPGRAALDSPGSSRTNGALTGPGL